MEREARAGAHRFSQRRVRQRAQTRVPALELFADKRPFLLCPRRNALGRRRLSPHRPILSRGQNHRGRAVAHLDVLHGQWISLPTKLRLCLLLSRRLCRSHLSEFIFFLEIGHGGHTHHFRHRHVLLCQQPVSIASRRVYRGAGLCALFLAHPAGAHHGPLAPVVVLCPPALALLCGRKPDPLALQDARGLVGRRGSRPPEFYAPGLRYVCDAILGMLLYRALVVFMGPCRPWGTPPRRGVVHGLGRLFQCVHERGDVFRARSHRDGRLSHRLKRRDRRGTVRRSRPHLATLAGLVKLPLLVASARALPLVRRVFGPVFVRVGLGRDRAFPARQAVALRALLAVSRASRADRLCLPPAAF